MVGVRRTSPAGHERGNLSTPHPSDDDRAGAGPEGIATVSAAPAPREAPAAERSTVAPPSTPEPSAAVSRPPSGALAAIPVEFPVIPGFEILEHLGQGGMGQVFKARQLDQDRLVALKIIRADRQEEEHLIQRFRREIKAGRRLDHPNIVAFYEDIRVDDLHFLTMEYVDGCDLAELLDRPSPFPVDLACDCVRQAALGLQHAHDRGLIHRDIKPSNLLLAKTGHVVKILDMGLARLGAAAQGEGETELTHTGVMMGTPAYMAPEQVFDARNADGRADIYSLGCTLYHLLAGSPPHRHQMKEPPPLHWARPEISPILSAVVRRMMARMPEDRYPAAQDVAKALAPFCGRTGLPAHEHRAKPRRSTQRLLWCGLGGILLLLVLAAVAWIVVF
jgi:serine/threonine protein kinase